MKRRIFQLLSIYLLFILIFALQKPMFMLYYRDLFDNASIKEWFQVMANGLLLDFSFAGYLTIIPGLLTIASIWIVKPILQKLYLIYYALAALFISCIFVLDLGLYEYWGFRLDSTPLFYFFTSPKDALASAGFWMIIGGVIALLCYAAIIFSVLYFTTIAWRSEERRVGKEC